MMRQLPDNHFVFQGQKTPLNSLIDNEESLTLMMWGYSDYLNTKTDEVVEELNFVTEDGEIYVTSSRGIKKQWEKMLSQVADVPVMTIKVTEVPIKNGANAGKKTQQLSFLVTEEMMQGIFGTALSLD